MDAPKNQKTPPAVRLLPVTDADRAVVERMFVFYLYDMSAFTRHATAAEGHLEPYPWLPRYWTDADRHAYLIDLQGHSVGFVFVRELDGPPAPRHEIAEFYVMPRYRGLGLGRAAAQQVFDQTRGGWRVAQLSANTPAIGFWRRVIHGASKGQFNEDVEDAQGVLHNVLTFRTA